MVKSVPTTEAVRNACTTTEALLETIAAAAKRRDVDSLCAALVANVASPILVERCCDALRIVQYDEAACAEAVACGAVNSVVQDYRAERSSFPPARQAGHATLFFGGVSWWYTSRIQRSAGVRGGMLASAQQH